MAWPLVATKRLTHDDYTVAWICALPLEKTAARNMLDELHHAPPQPEHDKNIYTFGGIGGHNVVIVCQGDMGTTAAAVVATRMDGTFRRLRFGLLVGIAGGVPDKNDVRLGDVIISKGDGRSGGVVVHDRGKVIPKGFESRPFLNGVPEVLRNAISELESLLMDEDSKISKYVTEATERNPRFSKFGLPTALTDKLFQSDYAHVSQQSEGCSECDEGFLVSRPPRNGSVIHFGVVASGNQVIKDSAERLEILAAHPGVLAIEMEAAGLMNVFGCSTVRGICDYADSHKNDGWQPYAAAAAAAVAKEVLEIIPVSLVISTLVAKVTDDSRVLDVVEEIRQLTKKIEEKPAAPPSGAKECFLVPFDRDTQFVGREDIMAKIKTQLTIKPRVALAGIGGVGKSQIAIEYCYRFRAEHPSGRVFWVHADSVRGVDQAYELIAERLGLSRFYDSQVTVFEQVSEWLSNEDNGTWLMIFDNADDEKTFPGHNSQEGRRGAGQTLGEYIPKSSKGFVIITTKNMRVGMRLTNGGEPIAVPHLAAPEAARLLRSKLPQYQDTDGVDTAELLNRLDYLPLAITHAAAYIRENQIELAEYTRILRKSDSDMTELLSEKIRDLWRDNGTPTSVFQTWELSFGQIRTQKPRAAEILSLMAVLDRNEIPRSLLLRAGEGDAKFTTELGALKAFYLITTGKGGETFTMHRLVQLATQNWLKNHGEMTRYQEEAVKLLSEAFPSGEYVTWQTCQALFPHAQVVLKYTYEPQSSLLHAALLYKVAWYEWRQGQYSIARGHSERAHDIRQERLGEDDPQTLSSLALLAVVLKDQGEFKAAEDMHRKVLERREKILGKEHQDTLSSMSDLAVALRSLGKYNDAEIMHRRALEGRQKVLGDGDSETLTSMTDLAMVLVDQGKYKIGETMHRQALERKWTVLGTEDPDTLASMESLAGVLEKQKKYDEAEKMYHNVLVLYRKVLGDEHPDTVSCMHNLAGLFSTQEKFDTAEKMCRQVLELYEKILGKDHPHTLSSMSNLALALEDLGRYDDAERMQREILGRSEKVLGKDHPDTLASMNNLACLLMSQGKYDEAEKMHRQVLKFSEVVLGKAHPDTLQSMEHLADVLRNQDKHEAAEEIDDCVQKRKERLEESTEDVENPPSDSDRIGPADAKESLEIEPKGGMMWDLGLAFVGYWKGMFRKRDRR